MKDYFQKKYFSCCKKYYKIIDTIVLILILIGLIISFIILEIINIAYPDKKSNIRIKDGGYEVTKGIYYE